MNRLTNKAPSTITVGGVSYKIRTSYICAIKTILALQDTTLKEDTRLRILLHNTYSDLPKVVPYDIASELAISALDYLAQNKEHKEDNKPILVDFEQDSEYIYSAILLKGIDLDFNENMHWWTFLAHFRELPEECTLKRIIYLRDRKAKGKLSKEEREEIANYGDDVININDPTAAKRKQEVETAVDEFSRLLNG